jgi:endonuclease/exonuclease/phosphatase (EEP) superfamily protein YafD
LLVATLAPYLHDWWWAFELPAHFHPQIALAAALLTLFALLLRQRIVMVIAAVSLIHSGLAINSVPTGSSTADAGISVLSQNLSYGNSSFDAFMETIDRENPDVLVLLEYTPEWEAAMGGLPDEYSARITAPDSGAFGIAMISRLPIESHEVFNLGQSGVPAIAARFGTADFDGTLVGMHLYPPVGATWATDRNLQLSELRVYLHELESSFIAIGDFNNTPWSPTFESFLEGTNWQFASPALDATWPSALGRFGIPIDLAITSPDVALGSKQTLALPGSDHQGIYIDFVLHRTQEGLADGQ